jgi:hypothetical protein
MIKSKNFWVIMLIFIGVLAYFYLLNPDGNSPYFLKCPFYQISGYQCPGCGSQRAFHEVLHLRLGNAFQQNALFVLAIPYVLVIFYTNFNKEKHQKLRQMLIGNKTLLFLLVVAIFFGILRNF